MEPLFQVEIHDHHIHITHPPGFIISTESAKQTWKAVGRLCQEHARSKVLIERTSLSAASTHWPRSIPAVSWLS